MLCLMNSFELLVELFNSAQLLLSVLHNKRQERVIGKVRLGGFAVGESEGFVNSGR